MTFGRLIRSYFTLGFVSWIPAIMAIYGAVSGGGGGGSGGTGQGGTAGYVPTGQPGADTNWQQLLTQLMSAQGGQMDKLLPYLMSAFTSGADHTTDNSNIMRNYGQLLEGEGGKAFKSGDNLRAAGDKLWETASDPQGALRSKLLKETQDASREGTSLRGIGMSGEAAGLESQAVGNFGLNWENAALGREATGLKGMSGAYDAAGRQVQLGDANLTGAIGMDTGAVKAPFDLASLFSSGMSGGVYNPASGIQGNIAQYLGMGSNAAQGNFAQNAYNNANLMNSFSGINPNGSGMGWLNNFFGSGGGNTNTGGSYNDGSGYGSGGGP